MAIPFVLTAAHVGRRQKLNVAGSEIINVRVGDPSVAWMPGSFIEVVRNSAGAEVAFTPFNGTVTLNYLGAAPGILNELSVPVGLKDGEYARLICVESDVWDLHIARLPINALTINTQPDDYTLQASDAYNTLVRMTKATATLLTIPHDTTEDMPIGASVLVGWNGDGQVTIVGEPGVTVDTPDTYLIGKKFGKVAVMKVAPNHWEIEGNLVPA